MSLCSLLANSLLTPCLKNLPPLTAPPVRLDINWLGGQEAAEPTGSISLIEDASGFAPGS